MSNTSKPSDMKRLRAAGFSVANAERLAESKRGPGVVLICLAFAALFLLGGVLVLTVDLSRPNSPAPLLVTTPTPVPSADGLAASTLEALRGSLQNTPNAPALSAQELSARTASGIANTLNAAPTADADRESTE